MALALSALGVVIVAALVLFGKHHLYLFAVLRRWPDENDLALRRRELATRDPDERPLATWWGRYQGRHTRRFSRRWTITGVLTTVILVAAGIALLVDGRDGGGPTSIRRERVEEQPGTSSETVGGVSNAPSTATTRTTATTTTTTETTSTTALPPPDQLPPFPVPVAGEPHSSSRTIE
jgi:hypothetical protein